MWCLQLGHILEWAPPPPHPTPSPPPTHPGPNHLPRVLYSDPGGDGDGDDDVPTIDHLLPLARRRDGRRSPSPRTSCTA